MPSPYSYFSTLCQEYGSVLLVQIRTWEALRKPTSPFPTMVLLPGEIEQSWLEAQLGRGRELRGATVPLSSRAFVYCELQDTLVPAWRCVSQRLPSWGRHPLEGAVPLCSLQGEAGREVM